MKRAILSLLLFYVLVAAPQPLVFAQTSNVTGAAGGFNTPQDVGERACQSVTTNQGACEACFSQGGAWTAIGCVTGNASDFVTKVIQFGTGIGGGIAFLLILFAGFQTMTSAGNPEKLHEAKELLTAAISGLLLIIFSVFLLRLIGVDILQIPGFG